MALSSKPLLSSRGSIEGRPCAQTKLILQAAMDWIILSQVTLDSISPNIIAYRQDLEASILLTKGGLVSDASAVELPRAWMNWKKSFDDAILPQTDGTLLRKTRPLDNESIVNVKCHCDRKFSFFLTTDNCFGERQIGCGVIIEEALKSDDDSLP